MIVEPDTKEFQVAKLVAQKLAASGFRAMLVGGSVRDMLMGSVPHDFDLVTTATPEELAAVFPGETQLVGASFGVSLVKLDGVSLEVATAREERNYLDGRHPECVRYTEDLRVDVARRDFTVNALLYDPVNKEVVDHVGGVADLEKGIIRCVGDPERRFSEDYLRMLRAVRFAGRFGFELDPATRAALDKLAPKCAQLSGERVREEMSKILCAPRAAESVRLMLDSGLLAAVLPEVAALSGVEQPPEFHPEGDVFTHTCLMLENMVLPNVNLAWSVLLHDVGKPACFSRDETGRIRFFGHEELGAKMAEKILDRLRFSVADRECIVAAIRNHMRFASVREMKSSKILRLLADDNFALELELHRLDCLSCHGKMACFVFLLDQLRARPEAKLPPPLLLGRDLVAAGVPPSPRFGKVLHEVYERQLAGELTDREGALQAALKMLQ